MGRSTKRLAKTAKARHGLFKANNTAAALPRSTEQIDEPTTRDDAWLPRMSPEEYRQVTRTELDGSLSVPDAYGELSGAKCLRPLNRRNNGNFSTDLGAEYDVDLTVNLPRMIDLFNTSLHQHATYDADSRDPLTSQPCCPLFTVGALVKWGQTARLSLKCQNCEFTTTEQKLYRELASKKPGPKKATCNVGLVVGLQSSSLGCDGARTFLAASGVISPCKSAMQRTSNEVSEKTSQLCREDMEEQRSNLRKTLAKRRVRDSTVINIQMDGLYASHSYGTRKRMGQACTAAVGIACEDVTDQHKVIACSFLNKRCVYGERIRRRGGEPNCPNHPGCTATIDPDQPISERRMGYEIGETIAKSGLNVNYATTDGDATSAAGLAEAMDSHSPNSAVHVVRQADPIHRGQSMFKAVLNAKFSDGMFPQSDIATTKDLQHLFAKDVNARSSIVMKNLRRKYRDIHLLKTKSHTIIDKIVSCYGGSCGKCTKDTTACAGGKLKSWWRSSAYLSPVNLSSGDIKMSTTDVLILRSILEMLFAPQSLNEMKSTSNTCKSECVNRLINLHSLKNKAWPRMRVGRVSSAILRANHRRGPALVKQLRNVGAHTILSPAIKKRLLVHQPSSRSRMPMIHRATQIKRFLQKKTKSSLEKADYKKGQLEPKPSTSRAQLLSSDTPVASTSQSRVATRRNEELTNISQQQSPNTNTIRILRRETKKDHCYSTSKPQPVKPKGARPLTGYTS